MTGWNLISILKKSFRYKLFGDGGEIQRLHEDAGSAIKRWPLTPGYILRPDGVPISESASEQAYEIFNGIAEEAENLARLRHDHPRQVYQKATKKRLQTTLPFFIFHEFRLLDCQPSTMDERKRPWKV